MYRVAINSQNFIEISLQLTDTRTIHVQVYIFRYGFGNGGLGRGGGEGGGAGVGRGSAWGGCVGWGAWGGGGWIRKSGASHIEKKGDEKLKMIVVTMFDKFQQRSTCVA